MTISLKDTRIQGSIDTRIQCLFSLSKITNDNWLRKHRFRNKEMRILIHQDFSVTAGYIQDETGKMSFRSRNRGSTSPSVFLIRKLVLIYLVPEN